MNRSEKEGFDLTESGFDPFSHLFFEKSYSRLIFSFCVASPSDHQFNAILLLHQIFCFVICVGSIAVYPAFGCHRQW